MVAVILPVGLYVGQYFAAPDDPEPATHEVRLGEEVFQLTPDEHAVWAMAFSDLVTVQSVKPSRTWVVNATREFGVTEPEGHVDDLLSQGLLAQVMPTESNVRRFAQEHRVAQLALGLGTIEEQPGMLAIGFPNQPQVFVGYEVYRLWCFADQYPSMWDACVDLAVPTQVPGTSTDPVHILTSFFEALPSLVSVNSVYIDRRRQ